MRWRSPVSILVFVELALDEDGVSDSALAVGVSILVFVELALDVWVTCPTISPVSSFNPCFRGTCS